MSSSADTRLVSIDGVNLEVAYTAPKSRDDPTLVFLHEGLGSISMWRDFPKRVAAEAGAGLCVYSRYGYGKSSPRTGQIDIDYMHIEAEQYLPKLLDALNIENPILVGHSDGASIALIYAGAEIAPVRAVIVEAPHVFCEEISVNSIAQVKTLFESTDLKDKLARHHADPTGAFYGWNDAWLKPEFMGWNIESYLPGITCPVLAIQGRNDEYGTMAQIEAIESGVGGAVSKVILDDCGHSPHRDKEDQVLQAMSSYIKSLEGTS